MPAQRGAKLAESSPRTSPPKTTATPVPGTVSRDASRWPVCRSRAVTSLAAGAGALLAVAALLAVLCLAAGSWRVPWWWTYAAVTALFAVIGAVQIDPGLIRERFRPGPGGHDGAVVYVLKALTLGHLLIAGLDLRLTGELQVPLAGRVLGLVGFSLGLGITIASMVTNRYFSAVVRLQTDRGHRLVRSGPYRYVRHPGYLGIQLMMLASGVTLGSWWSVLPMLVFCLLVVRRMTIEERFLRAHLPGYSTYIREVPYKLIPGIW